jgi:hypothetical protein
MAPQTTRPPVILYCVTITCASLCSTHHEAISNVMNVIAMGVLIMGAASPVVVTSFLICLRRAFAIGSLALRLFVDEAVPSRGLAQGNSAN